MQISANFLALVSNTKYEIEEVQKQKKAHKHASRLLENKKLEVSSLYQAS